jgi:CRISPR-associated endonuclease/helicase Cas3
MNYYSHSKENEDGQVEGSKLLKKHICGVREKALQQFYDAVNFGGNNEQLKELVKIAANFHDLGKYTSYFQHYLLNQPPVDHTLKQHARIGSYTAYNLLKEKDEKKALIALYLIFLHHSKLLALKDLAGKIDSQAQRVFDHQKGDLISAITTIEDELKIYSLQELLQFPDSRSIRKQAKLWVKKNQHIADYFLINYLFSLLIEADKLDASDTNRYNLKAVKDSWVDERFGIPDLSGFQNLTGLSNNELRNYCRAKVASHLQDEDILDQKLFTLTAPTGIGKTMTALDFALKLKAKMRKERSHEPQIIYALPFINIIEQALDEYQKTLCSDEIRVLGHYQFADIFCFQSDSDEEKYHQKLMKLDTWQGDIVITSFVQFFETAISNRNKMLKKFNHLAGSIIILDEVQTLRLDQMPLLGATLYYLAKFLGSRIIMMTATKPKIFKLAEQEILKAEGEIVHAKELLANHEDIFAIYERTAIHPMLNCLPEDKEIKTEYLVNETFDSKWSSIVACIIVCNTVNRSIKVYEEIQKYLDKKGFSNDTFYLSTNIIPAIRESRIECLKKALKDGKAPILIATQVVEAGVDLDFDIGFRDLGPIDSIIQVAGRINRNDDVERREAPLYIVDLGDCQTIYGQMTYQQAKKALEVKSVIPESNYLEIIEKYFDDISDRSSFHLSRSYFNSMKSLKYDSDEPKEDYAISNFSIIEESNIYCAVFIELDEHAKDLREKYLLKIKGVLSKAEFDRKYKMDFQQHIISVPHYYTEDLLPLNEYEENILVVSKEVLSEYYNIETGFKRQRETKSIMMF